jgi:hypothetical protein
LCLTEEAPILDWGVERAVSRDILDDLNAEQRRAVELA